jgi:hypothetical protein
MITLIRRRFEFLLVMVLMTLLTTLAPEMVRAQPDRPGRHRHAEKESIYQRRTQFPTAAQQRRHRHYLRQQRRA